MKKIFLTALIVATLIGCSSENETEVATQSELLAQADHFMKKENYPRAVTYLEALNTRFPRTTTSQQTALNLIYAYYQEGEYEKALTITETYFRSYGRANADYVLYMTGLSREMTNKNFFQDLFGRDPANRDTTAMKYALDSFTTLVQAYPNSPYAKDAQDHIRYISSLLARHELNVAKFYAKRDAWVAVANRLVELRKNYPNSEPAYECLPLLKESYTKLKIQRLANDVEKIIAQNGNKKFPKVQKPEAPTNIAPPTIKY